MTDVHIDLLLGGNCPQALEPLRTIPLLWGGNRAQALEPLRTTPSRADGPLQRCYVMAGA